MRNIKRRTAFPLKYASLFVNYIFRCAKKVNIFSSVKPHDASVARLLKNFAAPSSLFSSSAPWVYFSKSCSAGPLFLWIRIQKDDRPPFEKRCMIIRCMAHINVIFCVHLCGFQHTNIFRGNKFGPAAASGESAPIHFFTSLVSAHYDCAPSYKSCIICLCTRRAH
jgi:hypothetical protein